MRSNKCVVSHDTYKYRRNLCKTKKNATCTLTQHADREQLRGLQVLHHALGDHPHVVFTRDLVEPGRLQYAQRLLARAIQQHDPRLGRHQLLQIRVLGHQHRVEDREPVERQMRRRPALPPGITRRYSLIGGSGARVWVMGRAAEKWTPV